MRYVKDRVNRETLFLGRTILSYAKSWLKNNRAMREHFVTLKKEQEENPLQFYCPNGKGQLAFLNDKNYTISGMVAPNRTGKSTCAWIDLLLDIIPCDPTWKLFTEHGVKFRPFAPPSDGYVTAVATYELVNLKSTIWPQIIRKWTPVKYLEEYGIRGKGGRPINWKDSPRIQTKHLNLWMMYYSMSQTPYESQAIDRFMWDEQPEEAKFDGADERLRTRNGRHVFSLTPHKVEGRAETGAGTFVHDMALGNTTKGHSIEFYNCSLLDDVPDWIYPEIQKKAAFRKWVEEPIKNHDEKSRKEGRARLYGEWHETGGLVYDEWDRAIHLVDPFDIPPNWTRYRSMDWGRVNPTACLYYAVNEIGDVYFYDMYYRHNALVSESALDIITKSGNVRQRNGRISDTRNSEIVECYEEVQKTKFVKTVLDSRTFASKQPNSSLTIGRLYQLNGLYVRPASGETTEATIPIVKEWLKPDFNKIHPHTGKPGKPRIFFFRTLSVFIKHIEHYINTPVVRKGKDGGTRLAERPRAVDDHDMDAFRYAIIDRPRYIDGYNYVDSLDEESNTQNNKRPLYDKYTGY